MMDQQDLTNRMTSPPRAFRILGPLKGLRHQLLAPLACQVILSQDKHDEIWVWLKFGTPIWIWSIWWIISLNGQLGINPISGITLHPDPGGEFPPWLNNLVLFPFQIGLVSKSPDALGALLSGGISRVEAPILSAKPCKATKRNRPWIFEAASSLRHRASLALSPPLDLAKKQPMQLVTIHHQGLIHGYGPWVMSPKKYGWATHDKVVGQKPGSWSILPRIHESSVLDVVSHLGVVHVLCHSVNYHFWRCMILSLHESQICFEEGFFY